MKGTSWIKALILVRLVWPPVEAKTYRNFHMKDGKTSPRIKDLEPPGYDAECKHHPYYHASVLTRIITVFASALVTKPHGLK